MLVYQRVNTVLNIVLNIVLNLLEGLLRIWDIWLKVNRGLHLCLGFPMLRNHRPCGSVDSGTSYLSHLPCSSVVQAFYPTITTYILYIYHIISYHIISHVTSFYHYFKDGIWSFDASFEMGWRPKRKQQNHLHLEVQFQWTKWIGENNVIKGPHIPTTMVSSIFNP